MERLSKLFDEIWPETDEFRWALHPQVDVKETDNDLTFVVDLPGVKDEDIEVELTGDVLTICGKREMAKEERREDYLRMERNYGEFRRSFTLSFPVKPDDIRAAYDRGVLRVTLPKAEGAKAHKVPVRSIGKPKE
jgi:HSP20 family protein